MTLRPKARAPSGQKPSEQISTLFADPDSAVGVVAVANDRQVQKSLNQILASYSTAKDWEVQLDSVKQAMGIIKGGACNFISFVRQVDKLTPLLSDCIISLKSTLVKYGSLLVAQLAQKLAATFESPSITLIPILYRPTQNGTQIISDSCRYALHAIAHSVQSKKVLSCIIEGASSRSAVQRTVAANCIFIILTVWERDLLSSSFPLLEKSLGPLMSDSGAQARQFARDSFRRLSELFPDKTQKLTDQMDARTKASVTGDPDLTGPVHPPRRSASVDPKSRTRAAAGPSFSDEVSGHETEYLRFLQQLILQGESQYLNEHGTEIAKNLIGLLDGAEAALLLSAFSVTGDLVGTIPDAFHEQFGDLVRICLRQADATARIKRSSSRLLGLIGAQFPTTPENFETTLSSPNSVLLYALVDSFLKRRQGLSTAETAARLLDLCAFVALSGDDSRSTRSAITLLISIYEAHRAPFAKFQSEANAAVQEFLLGLHLDPICEEEDRKERVSHSASPSRIVTGDVVHFPPSPSKIVTSEVADVAPSPLRRVKADSVDFPPSDELPPARSSPPGRVDPIVGRIRRSLAQTERGGLEELAGRLRGERDKSAILRAIAGHLDASSGEGFEAVLPDLIPLCKSAFASEVERILQIIGTAIRSDELLDAGIPLLLDDDPACYVEFFTRVVACASPVDLTPRIRRIMNMIVPLLQHGVPEVRKYSVLCLVELRVVIGREFDPEIDGLKSLPRKLVRHYFQKRTQGL
jgi:hypothetical protein